MFSDFSLEIEYISFFFGEVVLYENGNGNEYKLNGIVYC